MTKAKEMAGIPAGSTRVVLLGLLLVFVVGWRSPGTSAQSCPHAGDVNDDHLLSPADARLALQLFLGSPPPNLCALAQANVRDPRRSDLTPADIVCMLQRFLGLPSCLDPLLADAGADQFVSPNPVTGRLPSVTLDGGGSLSRQSNTLMFDWRFTDVPGASSLTNADLSGRDGPRVTFTPDVLSALPNEYTLRLMVEDERGTMASDAVLVNVQAPTDNEFMDCSNCNAPPGEVVELSVMVTDAGLEPVPNWPVTFTLVATDGAAALVSVPFRVSRQPLQATVEGRFVVADTNCIVVTSDVAGPIIVTCFTDTNGIATALFQQGEVAVIVTAQAQDVFPPVIFRLGDDRDQDCLPNDLEPLLGLDPDNPQTNPGLRDGDGDFDADGLSNCQEVFFNLTRPPFDPANPDSDNDGVPDGDEDLDDDGLLGEAERQQGTEPLKGDTDRDGVSDGEEVGSASDPRDPDSLPFNPQQSVTEALGTTVAILNTTPPAAAVIQGEAVGQTVAILNTTPPAAAVIQGEVVGQTVAVLNTTPPVAANFTREAVSVVFSLDNMAP